MKERDNLAIAKPSVVLSVERDGWAVLFNPDSNEAYAINVSGEMKLG